MKLLVHQVTLLGILVVAYLIQVQIITPLEGWLQGGAVLGAENLLFLPHGASAVCAALSGMRALIPLLLVTLLPMQGPAGAEPEALLISMGPVAFLMISVMLINLVNRSPIFAALSVGGGRSINLFHLVLGTAALSSLLNTIFSSFWLDATALRPLLQSRLGADMLGTAVFIGLLLLIKAPLIRALYFVHRKHF